MSVLRRFLPCSSSFLTLFSFTDVCSGLLGYLIHDDRSPTVGRGLPVPWHVFWRMYALETMPTEVFCAACVQTLPDQETTHVLRDEEGVCSQDY